MPDSQSKEYSIVRLTKTNLVDVARLHSEVYGRAVVTDYFLKKYDTAYTGIENVGFIAYNKNNLPVAYYGVIPCYIQYENINVLAAQSADTMTHPKYRYKGMFAKLSGMTMDLCRELQIRFVFGFPNQDFYKAVNNKSNWKTLERMDCFIISVKSLPLKSLSQKLGAFKSIYKRYFYSVLKMMMTPGAGVANSVLNDGFAGIDRSNEYIKYKMYSDSHVIKVGDSKIWFSNKYDMIVGDMENVNEGNFSIVMNALKKIAKRVGVRRIQFHSSTATSLHRLFTSAYQSTPSFYVIYQDFGLPIPLEKIKFTFSDIDIF